MIAFNIENGELIGYKHEKEGITIPNRVTRIGNYAFYGYDTLWAVTIPDGVTSIGDYAFSGCSQLRYVDIPISVTHIGDRTFHGCYKLIVYCYKGSYAENYCIKNLIEYRYL